MPKSLKSRSYTSEAQLVHNFIELLRSGKTPFSPLGITREFDYQDGRTDIVALTSNQELVAFEAKLDRWNRALEQAYNSSSYANSCYVVLPSASGHRAFQNAELFKRRGVGLCVVDEDKIEVLIPAVFSEPLFPWISDHAREQVCREADETFANIR